MSIGQDYGTEFDETCVNCGDPLVGNKNWNIADVNANLQYCTKPECQSAKPQTIRSIKSNGKAQKKKQDPDRGLSRQIKPRPSFVRDIPDAVKVEDFKRMLEDPQCQNERGFPRYSTIFKNYGIDSWEKGFPAPVMAAAQYPDEVDDKGRPSTTAVARVTGYLKRVTKRYNGNLEVYSTKGIMNTGTSHRTEWRWHSNRYKKDLDRQVEEMNKIAANIQAAAGLRVSNFNETTFEQRMEKVTLLDQFYAKSGA
jgi:hypothetical protein